MEIMRKYAIFWMTGEENGKDVCTLISLIGSRQTNTRFRKQKAKEKSI